jgi:peptidoglycan/LPS O-acetylase OafA/YrhL
MKYRHDIDGLRAIAVLAVILSHTGLGSFQGGFLGVDIFFVISGYLIFSLLLKGIREENFSFVTFYLRRARRIIPALFVVMSVTLVLGFFLLLPEEYKNLGQSIVASTLFSNNFLLAITSGYWSQASDFKPLLHTWSLGVEEQFYLLAPIIIFVSWRIRFNISLLLIFLFTASLVSANQLAYSNQNFAYYSLHTRAWEILAGGMVATLQGHRLILKLSVKTQQILSNIGLFTIFLSFLIFRSSFLSPSYLFLFPVLATCLVLITDEHAAISKKILNQRNLVYLGLMSYSLYLWHQPIFAFFRAFSKNEPSPNVLLILMIPIFILSYLTWKFIEKPFREQKVISSKAFILFVASGSSVLISSGLYLNHTYGIPNRAFSSDISKAEMDKRIYNERIFEFKKDSFSRKDQKVLIIGNSFARDFTNIVVETFNIEDTEIIYRDDIQECIFPYKDDLSKNLFSKADVIVFSSGEYSHSCISQDIMYANQLDKNILYIGTKDFGYNLNWVLQKDKSQRQNLYNKVSESSKTLDKAMASIIPPTNYISLLDRVVISGLIPITNSEGQLLSVDKTHLTKFGALYFGKALHLDSLFSKDFVNSLESVS